jgi:putative nucleotidyltransferase with HDIG domain
LPQTARSLREIHPRELKEIVREIPTLPVIYLQLFQLMQDPDVTAAQLAEVISRDQALTTKLLHLVNSAFYGYRKQISTISRAVVVLGFRAVRNAALALSIFDQFKDEASSAHIELPRFWEHSIAVASICRVLAIETTLKQAEEAFVVGLLHDVGKLVAKRYFASDFEELCEHLQLHGLSWYEAERDLFPVDHAMIGRAVFRTWDFPDSIVEAIQLHHRPGSGASHPQLAALVHLANHLSYRMGRGAPLGKGSDVCDPGCLRLLGITQEQALALEPTFAQEIRAALEILKLIE